MEIKKEPLETYYELFEDIGKGQFATVKRCIHKETQVEYAAKFIRKRRGQGGRRGAKMEDIQKEIDILSSVSHRNIIRLYEVYETNREVILLLELVSGGELFEHLSEKDKLSEEEASAFIKQILDGVQHLHSKNIAHLDLKPENILLQEKNSTHVKLIDFGLSRKILPNEDNRAMMGTAEFVAPEVVSYEQLTLATDMWSIGVITYILLSGASPFLGDNQQETYHNITAVNFEFDEEYFNGTSELAKGFIRSLLVKDKRKRATIKDCLNHPWIKPVEKKQRDLRRSSIIKTEHLKKFIARQRWKRSMRVVSLCNRLSRSLQLRRIQSTDTLGSCSEDAKVQVSLSAPITRDGIAMDTSEHKGTSSPVDASQLLDENVVTLIAKTIIEDVIENVLTQLNPSKENTIQDLDSYSNGTSFEDATGVVNPTEDVTDPSDLGVTDDISLLAEDGTNHTSTIELVDVFIDESPDDILIGEIGETEDSNKLTVTSPRTRKPSRSKRKLSDLEDITEENIFVMQDTLDNDDLTTSTRNSELPESEKSSKEDDSCFEIVGNDVPRTSSVQYHHMNSQILIDNESENFVTDTIAGEMVNVIQTHKDSISQQKRLLDESSFEMFNKPAGSSETDKEETLGRQVLDYIMHDVLSNSGVFTKIDVQDDCFREATETDKNETSLDTSCLFTSERQVMSDTVIYNKTYQKTTYDVNTQNDPRSTQVHLRTRAPPKPGKQNVLEEVNEEEISDILGVKLDKIQNNDPVKELVLNVIEKAKLDLENEMKFELPRHDIKNDIKKTTVVIEPESMITVSVDKSDEMSGSQEGQTETDHREDFTLYGSSTKGNVSLAVPYQYDPLHLASFKEHHTIRDLFDIPEELDEEHTNRAIHTPLREDLKNKIMRQRLRKMSLQRRVQAKVIHNTAFNEMTKFRKLRDEKRIESFEMKVLKH